MRAFIPTLAALVALPALALAGEASGKLTFVHPDGSLIVVNSSEAFTLGPGVDAALLTIGSAVAVVYEDQDGRRVVTAIRPLQAIGDAPPGQTLLGPAYQSPNRTDTPG